MKKIFLSLLVTLFLFAGLAEANVYKYKYQGTTITASTDGQAPDLAWKWHWASSSWKSTPASLLLVDMIDATGFNVQYDTNTNTCNAAAVVDVNILPSIDGTVFDNDPYYAIEDIADAKIKTIPITPPSGFVKITFDETGGQTCTIDVQIEVTKPY